MSDSAIHSFSGALGGMVSMTLTYPLIFLSTRAAVDKSDANRSKISRVILDVIKREGIEGLYSGLSSSLLGVAVSNSVYYYFYERSREAILKSRSGSKALSTVESMLIGLIAGTATTILSNPLWVIQTAQTVETMGDSSTSDTAAPVRKRSMYQTIRHILAKDGIAAFWRGIGPALILVINPVLQYSVFEQLKNLLIARRRAKVPGATGTALLSDWDYFLLGAIGKLAATGSTYPYIVIKSRQQAGQAQALRYKSSLDGLLTVIREEGIQGLYKGVGSKLVQSVLTAAILFACQRRIYEITKKAIAVVQKK